MRYTPKAAGERIPINLQRAGFGLICKKARKSESPAKRIVGETYPIKSLLNFSSPKIKIVISSTVNLKIAVIAMQTDIGIAGGIGEGLIIKKGEIYKKVPEDQLLSELRYELENWSK